MLGKTHMMVGIACALFVTQPDTLPELVVGTGAAAVGALISDIDVGTSESHREADKMVALSVFFVLAIAALEYFFHIGIYQRLRENSSLWRLILGAAVFVGICAFGKEQPHRSFMHSILAGILLTGCVEVVFPMMVPYFGIAFATHLVTDLCNHKKVHLWYPLRGGICFGLCHAHGFANRILFYTGTGATVLSIMLCLYHMIWNKG